MTRSVEPGIWTPKQGALHLCSPGEPTYEHAFGAAGEGESRVNFAIAHECHLHGGESGLIHNRSRMLDPSLGRFLQRDPSGYVDGSNIYEYLSDRPLSLIDPSGLRKVYSSTGIEVEWDDSLPLPPGFTDTPPATRPTVRPASRPTTRPIIPALGTPATRPAARMILSALPVAPMASPKYGAVSWKVRWQLSAPAPDNGWIIQRISWEITQTEPQKRDLEKMLYWEAWPVLRGQTTVSGRIRRGVASWEFSDKGEQIPAFDSFKTIERPARTCGTIRLIGSVAFYSGYSLPLSFITNNPKTGAHQLPSTTEMPSLPPPTSTPIDHVLRARWDNRGSTPQTIIEELIPPFPGKTQ